MKENGYKMEKFHKISKVDHSALEVDQLGQTGNSTRIGLLPHSAIGQVDLLEW